ncbi:MAG TPA: sugar phosphate isomerase/epimerase [bacterium]|nr:sugar phosphate isomerase/epimerase [bacterium]
MRIGFMMQFDKERIDFAKKTGFKCCELKVFPEDKFFPGKPDWEARAREVKNYYDEKDIRISCLAGFYVNHMDVGKEEEYKNLVRNVILLAEKMGVGVVAGFSGRLKEKPFLKDSLSKYKEIWGEHARFAEDHNIKIAFEHCPLGKFLTPCDGTNFFCTPEAWDMAFNEVESKAIGLEWDPSHLICLLIDPVPTIRKYGSRIYHVHAKDAHINRDIMNEYGIWYPGSVEHCFTGFGDTDWSLVVKELHRQGYKNDMNIEGWHDRVYRNEGSRKMEDEGLILSLRHLEQFIVQD